MGVDAVVPHENKANYVTRHQVEVKSQRDRTSERQSQWLEALTSFGAEAVVLRVLEAWGSEQTADSQATAGSGEAWESQRDGSNSDSGGEDDDDFA